jgi:hypothetical protein
MSELGQFQTSGRMKRMSASPPEADIASRAAGNGLMHRSKSRSEASPKTDQYPKGQPL